MSSTLCSKPAAAFAVTALCSLPVHVAWQPGKNVEFIVPAGAGAAT